jgi:hypothetical protein
MHLLCSADATAVVDSKSAEKLFQMQLQKLSSQTNVTGPTARCAPRGPTRCSLSSSESAPVDPSTVKDGKHRCVQLSHSPRRLSVEARHVRRDTVALVLNAVDVSPSKPVSEVMKDLHNVIAATQDAPKPLSAQQARKKSEHALPAAAPGAEGASAPAATAAWPVAAAVDGVDAHASPLEVMERLSKQLAAQKLAAAQHVDDGPRPEDF